MYNYTVDGPPQNNPKFHFHKSRIGTVGGPGHETLESVLKRHGREGASNILKIDIEGAEWEVFDAAEPQTLERFSQIVCEFHNFSQCLDPFWRARGERVLSKLRNKFEVIHVHGNNYAPFVLVASVPVCDVLEVTFVNKSGRDFEPSDELFPGHLDYPNNPERPDFPLGTFQFS